MWPPSDEDGHSSCRLAKHWYGLRPHYRRRSRRAFPWLDHAVHQSHRLIQVENRSLLSFSEPFKYVLRSNRRAKLYIHHNGFTPQRAVEALSLDPRRSGISASHANSRRDALKSHLRGLTPPFSSTLETFRTYESHLYHTYTYMYICTYTYIHICVYIYAVYIYICISIFI